MDRRVFLASSAGALGVAACATPVTSPPVDTASADAALDALLTRQFETNLDHAPESVTNLGLDTGARAPQRGQLDDRSPAGVAAKRSRSVSDLAELRRINPARLSPDARLSYDIALFQLENAAAYARSFPYHSQQGWIRNPYIVTQVGGAYVSIPDFLDSQHPINTKADADAYLSRMRAFADAIDGETERVRRNVAGGAIAPDFILDKSLLQLRALRDGPVDEKPIVRSLARRAAGKGLGDYAPQARALFEGPIRAALTRQIELLTEIRPKTDHVAGIHRVPNGDAYYALNLQGFTTTNYTPDEIHRIGLEQVAQLQSGIDALLKGQGYTQGTVGERLNVLNKEPRFIWPNTDEGRAGLLASLNAQVADINPRMPRYFRTFPKAGFEIRRVPVAIEQGAPGGYAQAGSLDGSRPGAYYINLKDTAEWPKWGLPTLTYHEAVPGHLFQGAIAREAGELPLYRKVQSFSAYGEGWGLYSERVADELGVYENDPFGKIGYLQSFLFRAVRLVVDTGLHAKKWSREQAVRYMVENAAEPEGSAIREIERYCASPGQACSYKLGEIVISRLRADAERSMGPRFDIKGFHDVVLLGGSMPLTVLERRVTEWSRA
ncbi:MAG TPA: DUF885 family protein [Caulobacteraceae bacterium]|jgi:uncharacterized protein (DUF885 family)